MESKKEETPKKEIQNMSQQISLQDFLDGQISIKIQVEKHLIQHTRYVIQLSSNNFATCQINRKNSDFLALYEAINLKYSEIQLPKLPSKIDIFNKQEKRKIFYEKLLNTLIDASNQNQQVRIKIRKYLYNFFVNLGKKNEEILIEQRRLTSIDQSYHSEISVIHPRQNTYLEPDSHFGTQNFLRFQSIDLPKQTIDFEDVEDQVSDADKMNHNVVTKSYEMQDEKLKGQQYTTYAHPETTRKYLLSHEFFVKFENEEVWIKQFLKLTPQYLYLYKFQQNQTKKKTFSSCFFLYEFRNEILPVSEPKPHKIIQFYNKYDKNILQIKDIDHTIINMLEQLQDHLQNIKKDSEILKKELHHETLKPIGKIMIQSIIFFYQLKVKNLKMTTNYQGKCFYYVKVNHQDMAISTNKKPLIPNISSKDQEIQWNNSLYIPLLNNYSNIQFELVRFQLTGWIKENSVQEIIAKTSILTSDIISSLNKHNSFDLIISLQPLHIEDEFVSSYTLHVKFVNFSNWQSQFATTQISNYENQKSNLQEYERSTIKIQGNRLMRVKAHSKVQLLCLSQILNFRYIHISMIFYSVLNIFYINKALFFAILFFNVFHILNYILILLLLTIIYNEPNIKQKINENLNKILQKKYENKDYFDENVQTIKQYQLNKFLNDEKMNIVEKKGNLIQRFQKYQVLLGKIQYYAFHVVSLLEKAKNVITWFHYQKTLYTMFFILLCLFIYNCLPWRQIFLIGLLYRAKLGYKWYKQTRIHNQNIVEFVIQNTMYNKLIDNFFYQYTYDKNKIWDYQNPQIIIFEKKLIENLNNYLLIQLPNENILQLNKNYNELQDFLSQTHTKLYVDKKYKSKFPQNSNKCNFKQNKIMKILNKIFFFIYHVPSDYYLLDNPNKIN